MTSKLHPGERLDDLQLNGLEIIQNPERFCFGMDAVLLSDFAKVKERGDGSGSGNRDRVSCPFFLLQRQGESILPGWRYRRRARRWRARSVAL